MRIGIWLWSFVFNGQIQIWVDLSFPSSTLCLFFLLLLLAWCQGVCVYIYIFNFYNQVQIVWNLGCNNIVEKKKNTMAMGDVFLNINSMFWVIFKPFFSNKDESFISFWSKQKLVLYPFLTKKLCSPMNSFYVSIIFFFSFYV